MNKWFLLLKRLSLGLLLAYSQSATAAELPAPLTEDHYRSTNLAEAKLGQLLFWDPILSGNQNISCASCHHPRFGTSDGLSLGIGEGGIGLGPTRSIEEHNIPEQRIPRNSPALFNLGAKEFAVLFHDGRIEADPTRSSGLRTPLEEDMMVGFANALSAQTMFPVLSSDEMAGHYSENEVSRAVRQGRITGPNGAWDIIAKRVAGIEEYRSQFRRVYPEIEAGREVAFTDISNAIAAFIGFEWRSDDSPFDRYLRGVDVIEAEALAGMELFYGEARCSECHSGAFQTDHGFHAMGVPQIGPGKAARFEKHAKDVGRMRVTGVEADAYAFRTPSLRNVTETAPYGHSGAYQSLSGFVEAHTTPSQTFESYARDMAVLPKLSGASDWRALDDLPEKIAISLAAKPAPHVELSEAEIGQIIAFLNSLLDPVAVNGRLGTPATVPSGLPLEN
ncbi:cytochrome-c peroxidase [Pseudopelagicola sp. nBUS_19]|uniref:cytochrome-c peroxidase n=1 Tax=Pseudopelagicola sp. nBUS_19 TaxID=3395316 RepID=UPI003EBD9077